MTDLRAPHDIKRGERYAYYTAGSWRIAGGALTLTEEDHRDRSHYRLLTPDEISALPEGATVVNTATGDEGTVPPSGYLRLGLCVTYINGTARHLSLALLSLPEPEPTALELVERAIKEWPKMNALMAARDALQEGDA